MCIMDPHSSNLCYSRGNCIFYLQLGINACEEPIVATCGFSTAQEVNAPLTPLLFKD